MLNKEKDPRKATSASALDRTSLEKQPPNPGIGDNIPPNKLTRNKSEYKIREKIDGNLVPETVKNLGVDNVVRFLKAKVQILTDQLENRQKDERKLIEKLKGTQNTYTLSEAWSGVNWADFMAAQGAFGTDFYDRSIILRPKHRAYYR